MSSKITIFIAAATLLGGTKAGEVQMLAVGEELTAAKAKALGLSKGDVNDLLDRGALVETSAHVADKGEGGSSADKARAEKAEAELATAKSTITELETKIAALEDQLAKAATAKPAG